MKRRRTEQGSVAKPLYTTQEVIDQLWDDNEDEEMTFEDDYPDSEVESESDDNIVSSTSSESEDEVDRSSPQPGPSGDQRRPRQGKKGRGPPTSKFATGWDEVDTEPATPRPNTDFYAHADQLGPTNMPDTISPDSTPLDYVNCKSTVR